MYQNVHMQSTRHDATTILPRITKCKRNNCDYFVETWIIKYSKLNALNKHYKKI